MPKKNNRGFRFLGSKTKKKSDGEEGRPSEVSQPSSTDGTQQEVPSDKERYSSFVHVPAAETESKARPKKLTKKEKKIISEIGKKELDNKKLLVVSEIPDVYWECTHDIETYKEYLADLVEDALKISKVDVLYGGKMEGSDSSPAMSEEEEKSLSEFLRTLEMVDTRIREQKEMHQKSLAQYKKPESDYEVIDFSRGVKAVEPIAEEIFEEIVDEDVKEQEDPPFFRSTSLSPIFKRTGGKLAELKEKSPPKVLYSYNGLPFTPNNRKQAIMVQDIDDGILVINNIRCKEREKFTPIRQLDVILEESSDVSDTSSAHSDKKKDTTVLDRREHIFDGRGKKFDLQIQPVIKETVKIFPLHQNPTLGPKSDLTQVRIQTVVLEKVHPTSIVKIELPEKESDDDDDDGDGDGDDNRSTDDVSGVEIVSLSDRTYENMSIFPEDKSNLSLKSISDSYDIKFIDEDSEQSLSSGGFNINEDGGEADVESELDSRRETLLFHNTENDLSITLDDIMDLDDFPDYGTIKKSPFKDKNNFKSMGTAAGEEHGENPQKVTPSGECLPENNVNDLKSSPAFSGRDSGSSVGSGATVRKADTNSSQDIKDYQNIEFMNGEINLGYLSSNYPDVDDFSLESPYKNSRIHAQVQEIRKEVDVKKLAKTMEKDLDKVIKSKLKVYESFEDPVMSEKAWSNFLHAAKSEGNLKSSAEEDEDEGGSGIGSRFSLVKFKNHSNSSSYENVSKSRDSGIENENIYEAILGPQALSDLAEKKVMSLPYGHFLLKKIGLGKCCEDSKDAEDDMYRKANASSVNASDERRPQLTRSQSSQSSSSEVKSRCLPWAKPSAKKEPEINKPSYIQFNYSSPSSKNEAETWYGMRTNHPALLLGLSPSQKKVYEEHRKRFVPTQDEAASLLDLHKKFLERRSHDEWNPLRRDRNVVFDSNDVIYSEIIPKKKTQAEVGRLGKKLYGKRSTVEERSVARVNHANVDKDGEKSKDIGSCGLLAILQNATSDDSVPELTKSGSRTEKTENAQEEPFNVPKENHENGTGNDGRNRDVSNAAKKSANDDEERPVTTTTPAISDIITSSERSVTAEIPGKGNESKIIRDPRSFPENENDKISKYGDRALPESERNEILGKKSSLSENELFKQRMYLEYMSKVAERLERRQNKLIKISKTNRADGPEEEKYLGLQNEFINKVKERRDKLGLKDDSGSEPEVDLIEKSVQDFEELFKEEFREKDAGREGVANGKSKSVQFLLDPTSSDLVGLPKHLQEFLAAEGDLTDGSDDFQVANLKPNGGKQRKKTLLKEIDEGLVLSKGFLFGRGSAMFSPSFKATAPRPGVWSPVQTTNNEKKTEEKEENEERKKLEDEPIPPVWTPRSTQASPVLERKEFRPVNFESPTLPRKKYIQEERSGSVPPPWEQPGGDRLVELVKTPSSPALSLPKAPNPTVTLLQKAREGHIPRGARYLDYNMSESVSRDGPLSHQEDRSYSPREDLEAPKKLELAPKKIVGIGPTTKEGIPLVLRSEVTDENKEKWYKRMYDSLHKAGKDEDYVTVKYRTSPSRKGLHSYQPVSSTGYQSEPESIIYDSNRYNKYSTLDRRRSEKSKENDYISVTLPRSRASTPRYGSDPYRNQPGRIEDYEPGHSSISELEARQWWDEVLEIFDRWLERNPDGHGPDSVKLLTDATHRRREEERGGQIHKTQSPKSFMTYALKDSAFLCDPQHVFKRREEEFQSQLSPQEQKEAYRVIQKGGEVPLCGLRKPAPERPKDDRNAQIEYFPLSPTLTRIRVHKQNITPLNPFPFLQFPAPYQQSTLGYPNIPFGVCNSFSQVQIFPRYSTGAQPTESKIVVADSFPSEGEEKDKRAPCKNRKFSVQLQNISESKDCAHIVPKPRSQSKKSPIYANIPPRPDPIKEEISPGLLSPENPSPERGDPEDKESDTGKISFRDSKPNKPEESGDRAEIPVQSRPEKKTFFDFKRTAPSIVSKSLFARKETKGKPQKNAGAVKKTVSPSPKISSPDKSTGKSLPPGKENRAKTQIPVKKYKKSIGRLPLTQSPQREKPVAYTRSTKEICQNTKVKEGEEVENSEGWSKDLTQTTDSRPETVCPEECKPEEEEEEAMSPVYESSKTSPTYKHKVETNVTEAFRSRSFSPDVRRKIPRPVDPTTTAPSPPKRKQSKNSSTLRMWSKMMVTYPYHRSRLDVFDSNVKFLREKLRRKLDHDDKENETQFGEDIETVRTVRKDKDGSMSIKTNRYVSVPKPFPKDSAVPLRYTYNEHGRRVLSEPRATTSASKTRRYGTSSSLDKVGGGIKKTLPKDKSDTLVRSSTTYSVRRPASLEDKRKSVKVTVAVSSKGKEVLRKSTSLPSTERRSPAKTSTSPCPSVSSGRSGLSGRSPSDKGSTVSSQCLSPQNRFYSPTSSTGRLSSPSRSASPAYVPFRQETISPPLTLAFNGNKTKKVLSKKSKDAIIKSPGVKVQAPLSKNGSAKTEIKRKIKKSEKTDIEKKAKRNGAGKQGSRKKEPEKRSEDAKNEVTEHTSLVRTDSFFQNLFLRGQSDKRPYSKLDRTSSVLERARRFQLINDPPREYKVEPSLSLITYYLAQKRPVSLSRFKHLDRELSSSRSLSPCVSRSPSFQVKLRHFDSLSQFGDDDFGSGQLTPSLKGRSSSEPPLIRSQMNSNEERIPVKPPSRLSMSETSSLRTSPNSSRSPSCRRIQSFRPGGAIQEIRKKEPRARSAGDVEETKKSQITGSLTQSTSSLNLSNFSDHAEYQAYVLELMHSKEKCQRFRDLHKFYSSLERMGELERAMSISDLRPRLKNEEIIDFDRWKLLRTKERAEAELKSLVGKLLKVQKEKDLMFRTTDVEAVRWKGDRGLRLKERSVEDLKEQFDKGAEEIVDVDNFKRCIDAGKDVYKPFWRGSSIVNLANNLNATTASYRGRPVTYEELQRIKAAEERLKKKFGLKSFNTRTWSSLSNEQVDSLKTQLSEIFSQELRRKGIESDDIESYEITVPEDNVKTPGEKGLYVRCSSALSKNQVLSSKDDDARESKKSGSISALPSWKCDGGEKKVFLELPWKDDVDRGKSVKSRPMTENEKKRLSMTLSKEVLEKLKAPVKTHLLPRETLGAMVVASNALRLPSGSPQETFSPRTCYSLETSEDGKSKNDFLLVLTPTEKGKEMERVVEEWANGTSDSKKPSRTTSITELESASASSETSVKTVIRNPVDVLKKVEYYEELRQSAEESMIPDGANKGEDRARTPDRPRGRQARSHSLENIKEYFGEQQRYNVMSENKLINEDDKTRSEDFHSLRKIFEEDKQIPGYSPGGYRNSNDSIFSLRSRSVSPDPTKYYRAYLRMVKCGAVRKLRNKFESWEDLLTLSSDKDPWLPPKRYASDPELTRDLLRRYGTDPTKVTIRGQEVGDVRWLRTKYEKDSGNPRRRLRSPISRNPFTAQDRLMPRINVISKTAELQMNRRRSPDGTPTRRLPASPEHYRSLTDYTRDHGGYYYTGEVEKLRRKFEKLHAAERLSILGQMYTSTPDVSELRDIAPYLGCSWAAHRHPELSKASSPPPPPPPNAESGVPGKKKGIQIKPRPHSSSPVRPKQPLSILKNPPQRDIFADQKFDPSIHRPVYRYQPEVDQRPKRETPDYPHWRQWNKPSVKFKEPVDFFPETQDTSPDSPTKYVESEVTIHYKSPVRSEAKAALSEDELARRQAESMKRIYKEERRRKYLQELQDMNSRRHADNFIPSQKSPIPLNRYDDFPDEPPPRIRDHSTEPVLVARGLYDFVGRRPRELAFRRGDIIFIIKQLDKNWCEGELNGAVGLFPLSYVEIIPYNEYNPKFGRARAKYDFVPQTSLELSARKGEMITLVRKIDENWFEGRIGDRTGIIPASYCQILSLPQIRIPGRSERAVSTKPVAAPAAHSLIHNGNAVSSKHYYTPSYGGRSSPGRSSTSPAVREAHAAIDQLIDEALFYLEEDLDRRRTPKPLNLRVNPRPEPALYQVLFNHVPNNDDELELIQGETVVVLEKCGDGWYIGSKTNGRKLGIFPGTHVRRIAPEFV